MSSTKMSPFQQFIHKSRYARWLPKENRRENWDETVHRYSEFFTPRIPEDGREKTSAELEKAILNLEVMPSMRALMTAGPALEKDQVAGFNCSFVIVDDPRAFDETLYLSMCGVGVGFSVERQFVGLMPTIAETFYPTNTVIKVMDSKIGWATSLRQLISLLYGGLIPKWDTSALRPAGAVLKTFGGRASGPEPLERCFRFAVNLFQNAAGRKLNSLECHDLMCTIADCAVSGGVRRSALLSLSNLSDDRMRNAKNGKWWIDSPHRALSNNSVAYTEKPEVEIFMREWLTLVESKAGERGIFNREAAVHQAKKTGRRKYKGINFGVNPCAEIYLRPCGLCNLTEVVARPEDTKQTLKHKIRHAVILGCLQSTLTDFRYLRKIWQKNAEEERLLGVSLTGIADNVLLSTNGPELETLLDELREYALTVCKDWAKRLGINVSVAITCTKPSGTVSQLCGSSSGIHDRWSDYILRAVRGDRKDPLGQFLKASGVPSEPDVTKPNDVDVFYFPLESPKNSLKRGTRTAVQQLELYLTYLRHWCEHNPSTTIYVKQHEWIQVAAWVYEHFEEIGGVSFLPYSETIYRQPPYAEISEGEYQKRVSEFPTLDWSRLPEFEKEDSTTSAKELACSAGGVCELADFGTVAAVAYDEGQRPWAIMKKTDVRLMITDKP
jgi:ribonucleoside-triphosphate reductase